MTAGRGKGHRPDMNPTAPDFHRFVGAVQPRPVNIDMLRFIDKPRYQFDSSACVGFAFARAIDIRGRILNLGNAYPSQPAIYTVARLKDGSGVLVDGGCMPQLADEGLFQWGIVSEDRYPFDLGTINQHLPWDVIRAGSDARVLGSYRLDSFGPARVEQIDAALSAGYPVVYAQSVDRAFEEWHGGDAYKGPDGPSLGSHMQVLVYDKALAGTAQRRGVGSWEDFGEGPGTFRVTTDFLGSSYCTDCYIVPGAPSGVA